MRISLVLLCLLNSALAIAQGAEFSFLEDTHYLPEIVEGDSVSFTYAFTNTGDSALTIESIEMCHCIQANWPRHAIEPGESGTIEVTFFSKEMVGQQKKALLIWYNQQTIPFKLRFAITVEKARRKAR